MEEVARHETEKEEITRPGDPPKKERGNKKESNKKENNEKESNKKKSSEGKSTEEKGKRKPRWVLRVTALALLAFVLPGLYCGLTVRHYSVEDERIQNPVRIALVTDLHSCWYGKGQKTLLQAIEEQKPDVILLGGDVFDDKKPDDNTEKFLAGIAGKYPCYYVSGNHECWSGSAGFQSKMRILEKYGIPRLAGDGALLTMGETTIQVCGVDDPDVTLVRTADTGREFRDFQTQLKALTSERSKETYTILLTHRPELLSSYADCGFDLVLAGHAHGGQWRIPGMLNGLVAPNQGLFPQLAGGRYQEGNTTMIVSRGLARESTPVPRFYNPPELVIIDLK